MCIIKTLLLGKTHGTFPLHIPDKPSGNHTKSLTGQTHQDPNCSCDQYLVQHIRQANQARVDAEAWAHQHAWERDVGLSHNMRATAQSHMVFDKAQEWRNRYQDEHARRKYDEHRHDREMDRMENHRRRDGRDHHHHHHHHGDSRGHHGHQHGTTGNHTSSHKHPPSSRHGNNCSKDQGFGGVQYTYEVEEVDDDFEGARPRRGDPRRIEFASDRDRANHAASARRR